MSEENSWLRWGTKAPEPPVEEFPWSKWGMKAPEPVSAPMDEDDDQNSDESFDGPDVLPHEEYWDEDEETTFIESEAGWGGEGWRGKRILGKGGFGIVGLWTRPSEDGRAAEHLVIKQDLTRRGFDMEKPYEVIAMEELAQCECPNFVSLMAYRRFKKAKKHRMYLEYCPFGTLKRLIRNYRLWGHYLPEPFLWKIFAGLANAVSCMEGGQIDDEGNLIRMWSDEYIHRDIKPENVLMDDPDLQIDGGNPYPYPIPKLGDFGLAVKTHLQDRANPFDYLDAGTSGYKAPEQMEVVDAMSAWTNIWGIGAIMFELATLVPVVAVSNHNVADMALLESTDYSEPLRKLIAQCVEWRPTKRPTAQSLRLETQKYWQAVAQQLAVSNGEWDDHKDRNRVFYRGVEINQLSKGDRSLHRIEWAAANRQLEKSYVGSSDPRLQPPSWSVTPIPSWDQDRAEEALVEW
ncbi:kinase-like protein [Xylona heveae TC161]|uniref:non-specific serine/threonine protein kinase n=1 Tax=Xylona heveae (strain CBS 132557 / TC161) TaxID=1328760 RepID=A0A165GD77_XYLHT|nr:kinase-like protein [Xylona heveae TC161]KZF22049.1 kinase-like protein [Xylona heveae TC161]